MKNAIAFAGLVLAVTIAPAARAQSEPGQPADNLHKSSSKEDDIRKLLEIAGSAKLGEQVWNQMFPIMKRAAPQVPDVDWEEIDAEFSAEFRSGRFLEIIVPIYSAHFTHDEVKQLIEFYESPVGRKVIDMLPQIAQESMEAGQHRAQEIVKKVYEKLRKKGYSVPVE